LVVSCCKDKTINEHDTTRSKIQDDYYKKEKTSDIECLQQFLKERQDVIKNSTNDLMITKFPNTISSEKFIVVIFSSCIIHIQNVMHHYSGVCHDNALQMQIYGALLYKNLLKKT